MSDLKSVAGQAGATCGRLFSKAKQALSPPKTASIEDVINWNKPIHERVAHNLKGLAKDIFKK
ncbi:MAG: hypothetical protein LW809_01300 [Vampirovibrionales bacterium]|jgi:hypothetical protein|nr:hypothetical protein [Vampirovibrionales bacterium]